MAPNAVSGPEKVIVGWNKMQDESGSSSKLASTIFIGKWTVEILSCLRQEPYRHGELLRELKGVSQRVLTRTLRNLETAGLVARRVTRSRSIAVEYSLTPMGKTFMASLTSICRWADRHHKSLSANMRLVRPDQKRSHNGP